MGKRFAQNMIFVLKILIFPQPCKVYRTSYYKRTIQTQNGWIKILPFSLSRVKVPFKKKKNKTTENQ